jgi:hypothetical protein
MELLAMATNAEEEELAGEACLSGATMTNDGDTEGRLEKRQSQGCMRREEAELSVKREGARRPF